MTWYEQFDMAAARFLPEVELRREEPMHRYTSFRIGGPARRLVFPQSIDQLTKVLTLARDCGARTLLLGNGTNLLVSDAGLDALVIATASGLCQVERTGETVLQAQAGITLAQLALFAAKHNLSGLAFAHGIPGTLGGGIYMNAGAYDGEMKQVIASVTALYPEGIRTLTGEQAQFSYRHSVFCDSDAAILSATLSLQPGEESAIRSRMNQLMARRKQTQPLEWPSAGSTFKRPAGHFAGTLIEQTGLKGLTVGGAQVSEKHAGFLINRGGATCEDMVTLIRQVQQAVLQAHGVLLEPEVRILT